MHDYYCRFCLYSGSSTEEIPPSEIAAELEKMERCNSEHEATELNSKPQEESSIEDGS